MFVCFPVMNMKVQLGLQLAYKNVTILNINHYSILFKLPHNLLEVSIYLHVEGIVGFRKKKKK